MFAGFDSGRRRRALLLMAAAIAVNIALGQLVQHVLRWPLYLDAIGAILVGALLGPLAGAITGALSNLIVSVPQGNHVALPYAITAAFVGWAAGYAASLGAFRRLWSVLETVAPAGLYARTRANGLASLVADERKAVAVALMRRYNKVTHIFELVKAYGSTLQVEYDRTARVWQCRAGIAAKHEHEVSVNPFDGVKLTGAGHAPLVYAQDPRADIPAELQEHLRQAIGGADDVIVAGWMQVNMP